MCVGLTLNPRSAFIIHINAYVCIYTNIDVCIYVSVFTHVLYRVPHELHENRKDSFGWREQRTYICIRVFIYIYMYGRNIYLYEYTPIYIDMSRTGSRMSSMRMGQMSSSGGASGVYNISMYIRMHIHKHLCMYICVCIYIYTYIWIFLSMGPA